MARLALAARPERLSAPVAVCMRILAVAANDDDALGRRKPTTAFDPNGNKTTETVLDGPLGSAALTVTQMSWDPLNRLVCTGNRLNPAAFASLPAACAQSAGSAAGPDPISELTYDPAGQQLVEYRGVGTSLQQAWQTFGWSPDGNRTSITDANGALTQLGYDGLGRLSKITFPDNSTETSEYDPDGDLTIWVNRGGFGVVRCYDALNHKYSETGTTGASSANGTLACPTGGTPNLNTRSWDIQPRSFTYDLAGRLTDAAIPNFDLAYGYDAAGRALSRGGSWDSGDTALNSFFGPRIVSSGGRHGRREQYARCLNGGVVSGACVALIGAGGGTM